jgi:pimeloyl-ACP methyl ester carboxylesterase
MDARNSGPLLAQHLAKQRRRVGTADVAFVDAGTGPPVLLIHGCPFSAFVWRKVIAGLAGRYRCLAPDLLGLGDTETDPGADWSLPAQVAAIAGLLDELGIRRCAVVGHDHGGAIAQLLALGHPDRVSALVLANAEAYDNWPSPAELLFVRATQFPLLGRLLLRAWSRPAAFRLALAGGRAVADRAVLDRELVAGYVAANLADGHRRAKTRRFLAHQLDPGNVRHTVDAAARLPALTVPTLLLWGDADVHFPAEWGHRLARDIPGARLELLTGAGHLVMEERPGDVARAIDDFLTRHRDPAQPHADADRKP